MKAKLSVNINKVALLRNSREGNYPDLFQYAKDCEEFGADGITVHPRPDERHIRYADIPILKELVTTEFNIEGYPNPEFINLVLKNKPHQVTLVPDDPDQLTSDHGWDTIKYKDFLKEIVQEFQINGIRTSLFLDPDESLLDAAAEIGTDRIELYTGNYAKFQQIDSSLFDAELYKHAKIAKKCVNYNIGVNAGHDLNLKNLSQYAKALPSLKEVSIGHALTVDSLYFGLQNTISMYKNILTQN